MKKTILLLLMSIAITGLNAQNLMVNGDLESWDNSTTPTGWDVFDNVTQDDVVVFEGIYSAAQMSDNSSQKLRQDVYNIVGGQEYTISYYYLDNSTTAKTRIWSYWMDNGTYLDDDEEVLRPSEYSVENSEWQHYSVTLTAPLTANEFRFDVRTYKQDGAFGGINYFDDFSVSGQTVIYPEPSNYPSDFSAAVSGLSIDVTWTDATGDQLPTGYLILGEQTANPVFVIPTDGIPVDNDMDWSDGKVAVNVGYGVGNYLFSALSTNQAYSFIIFPFTNTGSNIDYKNDGTPPQTSGTTSDVTMILQEPFNSDLGVFSSYSVTGDQEWEWADYGDPPGCAKGSGYSGGPVVNEDWLISPELDLEGFSNITFSFDHARNYGTNDGLEIVISSDYSGSGDPNNANWDLLTSSFSFPVTGTWTFMDAGTADITSYASDAVYLAYIYTSTSDDAATWEIDNVEVLGIMSTGIIDNSMNQIALFPNPASNLVNIESDSDGELSIYSIGGKLLVSNHVSIGNNSIDISELNAGLYIVRTFVKDGTSQYGKLLVK
ncbi:MAG: T9SS type A sorting domain-containing protein [Lentimicrobiaceae bacterium]|jgi:hypothetical protein|nr:T9SS type A sorting domain-containing protein [Lentimicrobiaceae bacterium]MCP4909228.1 T9SS type A sorting domain-containing protein [Bacteroidota bacterium]MBT3453568.1 T9SS type A sorting domain-containing protein [Lentimicrobiaceae bacterium]MBT3818909.1 T9SS type A sorting domain-containing protein [Lentimicrobiaceae bacterium]MBT4467700.1 T9SS type A sorting domain-containing protein [Lentimicrobiaceae bacterium]